jgi:hypothetical protein
VQISFWIVLRIYLKRWCPSIWNRNDYGWLRWVKWIINILTRGLRYILLLESDCSWKRCHNSQRILRKKIYWWPWYWRCDSYSYFNIKRYIRRWTFREKYRNRSYSGLRSRQEICNFNIKWNQRLFKRSCMNFITSVHFLNLVNNLILI